MSYFAPRESCRFGVHRPRTRFEIDENHAIFDARGENGQTRWFGCAQGHACLEIKTAPMQRAYDRRPGHDAVAERAAFVRTRILDGEKPAIQIENGDLEIADAHRPPFSWRNVF